MYINLSYIVLSLNIPDYEVLYYQDYHIESYSANRPLKFPSPPKYTEPEMLPGRGDSAAGGQLRMAADKLETGCEETVHETVLWKVERHLQLQRHLAPVGTWTIGIWNNSGADIQLINSICNCGKLNILLA